LRLALTCVALLACDDGGGTASAERSTPDAAPHDAAADAPIDAATDAPPDAAPDAAPERFEWIPVEPGVARLEARGGERLETPEAVSVDAFEVARREVTNAHYAACIDAGACTPNHADDRTCLVLNGVTQETGWNRRPLPETFRRPEAPVVCVDFAQAEAYAAWADARLPTEAEWTLAALGTDGRNFPWGNDEPTCELAIIRDDRFGGFGCGARTTWDPCERPQGHTPAGACDVIGNAAEWTADAHTEGDRTYRVARGGAWSLRAGALAITGRRFEETAVYDYVGFRVVR